MCQCVWKILSAVSWKVVSIIVVLMGVVGCGDAQVTSTTGQEDVEEVEEEEVDLDTAAMVDGVHAMAKATNGGSSGKTYHLPFGSGETYVASTYPEHAPNAWDFNLSGASGSGDCGQPVLAVADGVVSDVVNDYDKNAPGCLCYGNHVQINHDSDNYFSQYGHMGEVFVVKGQWVSRGQAIGTIGNTGDSTGCHLHLQIENSSGSLTYSAKYYRYSGGSKNATSISNGGSYMSCNNEMFDEARSDNGGSATVGTATMTTATAPDDFGFSKSYSGGSYGYCAIYYQALGCNCGDFCPTSGVDGDGEDCINNTNYAWLVRTGFYEYYDDCGGPADTTNCKLGYPTGDEYPVSGGARQNFENGYLIFRSSDNSVTQYSY